MALKTFNPRTPGQRQLVIVDRSGLWSGKPEKSLTEGLTKSGGRNNLGRVTARRRGGGHKRSYRIIDFKRRKFDVPATVERLEYDPNRSAFIALVRYEDGELSYILAPQRVAEGDVIVSGQSNVDVKPGNAMPLRAMPVGTIVHNVELKPGRGGQMARSAGAYAQIVGRDQGYTVLRLGSGEQRLVQGVCMATVGAVSNPDHSNVSLGKAGRSRWLGRRPSVRGVAMNPIDHPHGGGEGRTSGGRHPVTPWGKPTKGKRTRSNKASQKYIVRSRHARKK
ncbi:50S ribosomal protein L2 [Afifella marina]|uniref:Large ribosomal subunit protein uL2 n=1 Tax=Afifella marina DSM 2698 TaxID=1120955 RepID=A0A1G5PBJ9_AFIMA|nr:50S ribosomal protein L2 [Afifella marina]MBK1625450.1 50S ribosomal protein L2 [Afifella marina DSM 2698]MBK1629069.1 50S ribosomal protein L2 [Afifella marina]MBK5917348.1 50S ribosomal protein L2 [Afifella marina]RAI17480.1 50S ribosomal protein L2 [Afifella marina DSM 2698]SCZ46441.1 LSU ribosomal protein L2P [Afifella marina DSM 2698]